VDSCTGLEETVPVQGRDYSARLAMAAGLDIAVRYRPAGTGLVAGDWYDTLLMPGGDLLLVVGDVAGHGVAAVTGMIAARSAVRALAAADESPSELLRKLNFGACHAHDGTTGTIVCGRYNPATRVMRWGRAGHLPPVLVRDGAACALDVPHGLMLGVDTGARYDERDLHLLPGDTLLLYTDGLIERRAGSISDALADLEAAAIPAGPSADSHAARILASAASDTGDDACLLVVRVL
jgi:serine phosphatase RsbU (regulator of sigma subunit)